MGSEGKASPDEVVKALEIGLEPCREAIAVALAGLNSILGWCPEMWSELGSAIENLEEADSTIAEIPACYDPDSPPPARLEI